MPHFLSYETYILVSALVYSFYFSIWGGKGWFNLVTKFMLFLMAVASWMLTFNAWKGFVS